MCVGGGGGALVREEGADCFACLWFVLVYCMSWFVCSPFWCRWKARLYSVIEALSGDFLYFCYLDNFMTCKTKHFRRKTCRKRHGLLQYAFLLFSFWPHDIMYPQTLRSKREIYLQDKKKKKKKHACLTVINHLLAAFIIQVVFLIMVSDIDNSKTKITIIQPQRHKTNL